MTDDLQDLLDRASKGDEIDWAATAWGAAQPILDWLGYSRARGNESPEHPALAPEDLDTLCRHVFARFHLASGELAWSSRMIEEAVDAVSRAVSGPPEPLVRTIWHALEDVPATPLVFEFCRALGITLHSHHRGPGWDLRWATAAGTTAQLCLRYRVLGLRPELCDDSLVSETQAALIAHGLQA